MDNPRRHGNAPFRVAVVHGGPGACGDAAPVARALARRRGVLEPIQTATTLAGQVAELTGLVVTAGDPPVALVGHSWGAWLAMLVAAARPDVVARLVLVGSGPLDEAYVPLIRAARERRLAPADRAEYGRLAAGHADGTLCGAETTRLGDLCAKADVFDPLPGEPEPADAWSVDSAAYGGVWTEAAALRRSGGLLDAARALRCPVTAIHGAYDPHPADGVETPLRAALGARFRLVLLDRCGHTPWRERHARDAFLAALEDALA